MLSCLQAVNLKGFQYLAICHGNCQSLKYGYHLIPINELFSAQAHTSCGVLRQSHCVAHESAHAIFQ